MSTIRGPRRKIDPAPKDFSENGSTTLKAPALTMGSTSSPYELLLISSLFTARLLVWDVDQLATSEQGELPLEVIRTFSCRVKATIIPSVTNLL
jgi:hypothetical protein